MPYFNTIIKAIDPIDGELKEWVGPTIKARSLEDAKEYCREELGYCDVRGNMKLMKYED